MTPGITYGFKVQARNAVGLSDYSIEFKILCASVPSAPIAPLTIADQNYLTINWTAPYNGGSPIIGYNVYL